MGPLEAVEFNTASRMTLVLAISGTILVAGLLLIYLSVLRHPAALLLVGAAVLTVGWVFPEPVVLAVQASLLGLMLVLVARVLQWSLSERRYRLEPVVSARAPVSDSSPSERSSSTPQVGV